MKTIFENKYPLHKWDIVAHISTGLGIIAIGYFMSKLWFRMYSVPDSGFYIIFVLILLSVWAYQALTECTVKRIEYYDQAKKLILVMDRQLKRPHTLAFELSQLKTEVKILSDRFLPLNRILILKDNKMSVKIATRQKGIGQEGFNTILRSIERITSAQKTKD